LREKSHSFPCCHGSRDQQDEPISNYVPN
jgi:hypothetical protein